MMIEEFEYLQRIEEHAAETGWVAPMTQEDRNYFAHPRCVCARYNISLSHATPLELDFVDRVTESELRLNHANA